LLKDIISQFPEHELALTCRMQCVIEWIASVYGW